MKKWSIILLLAIIFTSLHSVAQNSFLPQNLGDAINSEYNEINPIISPDGKTLYFSRINHPLNYYGKYDSQDVWVSQIQPDGNWGPAMRLDNFINSGRYNAILGISGDGSKFLISGIFTKSMKWKSPGLSLVIKTGDNWGAPKKLKIKGLKAATRGRSFNATLSNDGNYILVAGSRRSSKKKLNISVTSYENGKWTKLKSLGDVINSKMSEEAPFLSDNKDIIYFSSKKSGGKGDFDIYLSKKTGTEWSAWDMPRLVEGNVNSAGYESYFKLNKKGTYAYFCSSTGAKGGTDIFKIKMKEDQPFLMLTGKVINRKTFEPVKTKSFTITANNKIPDSININYDSATYKMKLKLGAKYTISANVKNFVSVPLEVDASEIKEYTEDYKDLLVDPLPYVLVKGSFIIKSTGMIVPPAANAKLFVDTSFADGILKNSTLKDSAKVKISNATYSIKLPYGQKYILMLNASKYKAFPDTVDLTGVSEYKEIERPLYAEKENELVFQANAVVAGKVINRKTGKPLDSKVPFSIVIDKIPNPDVSINSSTAEYNIKLPLGTTFIINAKAEKFYPLFETIDLANEKNTVKIFKDLVVTPIEAGQSVRMNNIFFQTGKAILDPKSFPELDKLAAFLKDNPSIMVEIQGHTDNVGNAVKNMQLSRWRSRSVKLYIESKGVPVTQVSFNGFGSTKPVVSNKTAKGKALNRRVEFLIKDV